MKILRKIIVPFFLSLLFLSYSFGDNYSLPVIKKGWNLVGFGKDGSPLLSQIASNMDKLVIMWAWDSKEQKWCGWSPDEEIMSKLNKLVQMSKIEIIDELPPYSGFWVLAKEEFNSTVTEESNSEGEQQTESSKLKEVVKYSYKEHGLDEKAHIIKAVGDVLWVGNYRNSLRAFKFDNNTLEEISNVTLKNSTPISINYRNNYLIVGGTFGIEVFDISNPTNPTKVWEYNDGTKGMANSVILMKNRMFVADDDNGLLVFDISDIESPELINKFYPRNASDVITVDEYKDYLLIGTDSELYIVKYDFSSDTFEEVSHVNFDKTRSTLPYSVFHAVVYENYLYTYVYEQGIAILDISDIQHPKVVKFFSPQGDTRKLIVYKHYLLVRNWYRSSLVVFDISNPTSPQLLVVKEFPYMNYGIDIINNKFIVVAGGDGIYIFELTSEPQRR